MTWVLDNPLEVVVVVDMDVDVVFMVLPHPVAIYGLYRILKKKTLNVLRTVDNPFPNFVKFRANLFPSHVC